MCAKVPLIQLEMIVRLPSPLGTKSPMVTRLSFQNGDRARTLGCATFKCVRFNHCNGEQGKDRQKHKKGDPTKKAKRNGHFWQMSEEREVKRVGNWANRTHSV